MEAIRCGIHRQRWLDCRHSLELLLCVIIRTRAAAGGGVEGFPVVLRRRRWLWAVRRHGDQRRPPIFQDDGRPPQGVHPDTLEPTTLLDAVPLGSCRLRGNPRLMITFTQPISGQASLSIAGAGGCCILECRRSGTIRLLPQVAEQSCEQACQGGLLLRLWPQSLGQAQQAAVAAKANPAIAGTFEVAVESNMQKRC